MHSSISKIFKNHPNFVYPKLILHNQSHATIDKARVLLHSVWSFLMYYKIIASYISHLSNLVLEFFFCSFHLIHPFPEFEVCGISLNFQVVGRLFDRVEDIFTQPQGSSINDVVLRRGKGVPKDDLVCTLAPDVAILIVEFQVHVYKL